MLLFIFHNYGILPFEVIFLEYSIQPIDERFRTQVDEVIKDEWHGPLSVSKGNIIDTSKSHGFVAVDGDEMKGCITYHIEGNDCEILTLNSLCEGKGIASALIRAVIDTAKQANCHRCWLITSNDNIHAIRFYQRFGFSLIALHLNALDITRRVKPSVPLVGMNDIPLLHELEFEIKLFPEELI